MAAGAGGAAARGLAAALGGLARPGGGRGLAAAASAAAAEAAELPDLPYGYGELAPAVVGEIMELHHSKHHATYVKGLNAALEQQADAQARGDVSALVALQPALKFNGGGHLNHSIFWTNLCPPDHYAPPEGGLAEAIDAQFGSLAGLQAEMSAKTAAVQGSGWGWLGYDRAEGLMKITTTANQDPLLATTGLVPLLGIDVWEHAYYLQYRNVRPDYLREIWKVVNWQNVSERLAAAQA